MQAEVLSQAFLASRSLPCLQIPRPASSQNSAGLSRSFATQPSRHRERSVLNTRRRRVVRSAQQEDFAEVEEKVKSRLPSTLKLRSEPRRGAVEDSSKEVAELQTLGTVREVVQAASKAVENAPVQSVGQVALYGGVAAFILLLSGSVLNSVATVPFAPEALEAVGVVYSIYIASQVVRQRKVSLPPPSPFRAVIDLVDGGQSKVVSKGAAAVVENLVRERDMAVDQAGELRRAAEKIASAIAEKEALEAVSLQLVDERDGAMAEVSALKDAIGAMTNRIKAIEEMLEKEVSQLKLQNQALETVSLQLAAERDAAILEMEQMQSLPGAESWMEEKEALEMVAVQLAQERDIARSEIEELKKVVGILREAASTSSGLTSEQEIFIKSRVREIRSQFIDLEHVYEEQKEKVDSFVEHLVQEFGVPEEWTLDYIKQFLKSSASKQNPPTLNVSKTQVESLSGNASRTS